MWIKDVASWKYLSKLDSYAHFCSCTGLGGDLVYIPSREYWGALVEAMKANSAYLNQKYFLGLVGKEWVWMTSEQNKRKYIQKIWVLNLLVNK